MSASVERMAEMRHLSRRVLVSSNAAAAIPGLTPALSFHGPWAVTAGTTGAAAGPVKVASAARIGLWAKNVGAGRGRSGAVHRGPSRNGRTAPGPTRPAWTAESGAAAGSSYDGGGQVSEAPGASFYRARLAPLPTGNAAAPGRQHPSHHQSHHRRPHGGATDHHQII